MHIPDGFIDAPTSAAAAAVAVGALAVCVRRATAELDEARLPVAGLAAAFVFAAQMVNFPVASGTSGHLLGGVLAAVLLGPWLGAVCVAVVLIVQCLLFADGGITALGLNICNMSLVGAWGGYLLFVGVRSLLPKRPSAMVAAAGIAAGLAPVLAAGLFTVEYALGGNDAASVGTVAAAMLGVHALIGIGEGVITALTVSAVLRVRPDLVYGADALRQGATVPAVAVTGGVS